MLPRVSPSARPASIAVRPPLYDLELGQRDENKATLNRLLEAAGDRGVEQLPAR